MFAIIVVVGFIAYIAGAATLAVLGLFRLVPMAMLVGLTLPAITASVAYKTLLPVRSGTGSAVALQAESFRRFLQASEGRHVEWAWTQGVLREYSAWAVSLGAADAWGKALASSNIAAPELVMNSPMLVYSMRSSMTSAHTAPSSSGSGGGGGFSGGSVGGGGGGGSSGSW